MSRFQNGGVDYDPAQYGKNRPGRMMLVDQYFKEWESRQLYKGPPQEYQIPPNICLSRQVGVGALEVADLLSQDLGLPVVDKMILDIICESKQLTEKTVQIFDERRPGLFGEKSFISGDYSRELLRAVAAIAGLGPNIFLGRGAYLLLPRNRTLAVRLVGSREYRSRRIAQIMERELVTEDAVGALERFDREQQGFFKKMFRKKEMTMEEFDLVINREQFPRASSVTAVIKTAYTEKFKDES